LKKLGFTEYEAKAYISLVGFGMATAREIHEHSGVPQGRIYSVLKSLSDKNYIEIQEGNPSYYYAENPGAVLGKLKNDMNVSIDKSIEYLSELHLDSKPPSTIWAIHSEWGIKNRLKTLIQNADREILILVDDYAMFAWIKPELKKVKKKVYIEIYAKNKADFAGTNFRVSEFSENLINFGRKVSSLTEKTENHPKSTMTLITDEVNGFFVGSRNGKTTGVIIKLPQLTYTLKAFIKMLDEK
jgi:sugar-specific transcriptional regulator TrmB